MLPGSNERVLSISGVADAIHIAVYYVGTILVEWAERNPGNSSSAGGQYRQSGPGTAGGMAGGVGREGPRGGSYGGGPGGAYNQGQPGAPGGHPAGNMAGAHTQQIFIPNSLVGASEYLSFPLLCSSFFSRKQQNRKRTLPS